MSKTYKAIGINLKGTPMGESDRLLTILTKEFGLIRAVAPGSRKHESTLRGRSGLFVINQLLLVKGRNLDKIVQAESLTSFVGLSQDLRKLTASQYLAELVLCQALSDHPQEDLFNALREHLLRLEQYPSATTLACLTQAIFHLLALAGIAPRLQVCCITQQPITPNFQHPDWRVGFSAAAGGMIQLSAAHRLYATIAPNSPAEAIDPAIETRAPNAIDTVDTVAAVQPVNGVSEAAIAYPTSAQKPTDSVFLLSALELFLLQQLAQPDLIQPDGRLNALLPPQFAPSEQVWRSLEHLLRYYAQYHFERPIRSARLIDTCFLSEPDVIPNHDAIV